MRVKILGIDEESIKMSEEWSERTQEVINEEYWFEDCSQSQIKKPISNSFDVNQDDVTRFFSQLNSIQGMNKEFQSVALATLQSEFKELWERVKKYADSSKKAKILYLKMAPYFEKENMGSLISKEFDTIILPQGWIPSQLYTISGLSGGGKTSLAVMMTTVLIGGINTFHSQIKKDTHRVLYVNLEQQRIEIEKRIISTLSILNDLDHAISYADMMDIAKFDDTRDLNTAIDLFYGVIDNLKIIDYEDFDSNDVDDVCKGITEQTKENDYEIVFLDQFVNLKDSEEISERNANALRNLARTLHIPIVVLTQMSKESQRVAMKSDGTFDANKISGIALKGASSLEQQSSYVTFILPTGKKQKFHGYDAEVVTIANKKGRYGQGEIQMLFVKAFNLFVDLPRVEYKEKTERKVKVNIDEKL